jgi:hypothetical protein
MNGSGGHCAKLNKPGTEKQVQHTTTHILNIKNVDLIGIDCRKVVPRGWRQKGKEGMGKGYKNRY